MTPAEVFAWHKQRVAERCKERRFGFDSMGRRRDPEFMPLLYGGDWPFAVHRKSSSPARKVRRVVKEYAA